MEKSEITSHHLNSILIFDTSFPIPSGQIPVPVIHIPFSQPKNRSIPVRILPLQDPYIDVAASYNKLGEVYVDLGELERAKECYLLGLEICEEQLSPKHVDVAGSCNNLGAM